MYRSPIITINGDRVTAYAYIRSAKYELQKLEEYMGFNSLEQAKRGPVVISADGVTVEVAKRFGDRFITITVPEGGEKEKPGTKLCLCNCNFSVGWVIEKQEDTVEGAKLYTVMACNFKRGYVRYTDVLATDWTEYKPGQKVMLLPYYRMAFLCCETPAMDYGSISGYGCRAEKSTKPVSDEDWRTAYRIIPYMARPIPLEIEVRNG